MAQIVTVTLNPTVDRACQVDQVVAERKLRCRDLQLDPGGGGINVARAARELGADSFALWTAGGPAGARLRRLLDADALPHEAVEIEHPTRDNLTVEEERSGQRFRFVMPGPTMSERELDRCRERIDALAGEADYLVLSGSLPPGAPATFYGELARQVGGACRVVVDTSGEPLAGAVQAGVFLLKPNLRELAALTGRALDSEADIGAAAQALVDDGAAATVVVSLGSGGALWVDHERQEQVRSPTVPQRSKVGAGDSMVGGLVTALARGDSPAEAVRVGVAAGAAAVMTPGTSLCRRPDVERLRARMSW